MKPYSTLSFFSIYLFLELNIFLSFQASIYFGVTKTVILSLSLSVALFEMISVFYEAYLVKCEAKMYIYTYRVFLCSISCKV